MSTTDRSRTGSAGRRRTRVVTGGLVALLAAAGAPSAAHAVPWTPTTVPTSLSGGAPSSATRLGAATAVAPDGAAWVTWIESVALSPSGTADAVRVARRAPDGTLGVAVEISRRTRPAGTTSTSTYGSAIALDRDGRPSVLWSVVDGGSKAVHVSSLSATGAWSTPRVLGTETVGASGFESSIVVHEMPDGRTAAAWRDNAQVQVSILGGDGTWGTTETVASNVNTLAELDLAADAEGRLTALWSRTPDLVVVSATRSASGTWSDPVVLEAALEDGDRAPIEPHIAADAQGELIATWSPGDDALMVATRGANATNWSVERRAVRGSHDTIRPDVAFDRFGNATLVWGETIASIEAQRYVSYGQGTPYGTWTLTAPSDLPVRSTPAPGAPVTVEPPTTEPPTIDPPTTAPPTTLPPTTAPPEVTGPPTVAPTTPTPPAPGGAAPPQEPRVVRISGRVLGKKAARRTLTVRLTTRVGTRAKRSYSVVLRRGTRIVATGTLRGTTLRLSVRSTAKKGRKAKYARIRGTYTLATPNRVGKKRPTAAQRITSTRITVR